MNRGHRSPLRGPIALAILTTVLLTGGALGLAGSAVANTPTSPTSAAPVTGTFTGPATLGYNATEFYTLNATGGPAVSPTGQMLGNITYYLRLGGSNLTSVSISPTRGILVNTSAANPSLTVHNASETITIYVMISSTYLGQNESINLTYNVLVVQPYTLSVSLTAGPTYTILSFQLDVYLDGNYAGVYSVPTLTSGEVYTIKWSYATAPLSSGWHTFTFAIPSADQGLVTFPNGQSTYAYSFYITGPAPDYTLWIVAGVLAFVAVAFISLILVGGRRRNRGRS